MINVDLDWHVSPIAKQDWSGISNTNANCSRAIVFDRVEEVRLLAGFVSWYCAMVAVREGKWLEGEVGEALRVYQPFTIYNHRRKELWMWMGRRVHDSSHCDRNSPGHPQGMGIDLTKAPFRCKAEPLSPHSSNWEKWRNAENDEGAIVSRNLSVVWSWAFKSWLTNVFCHWLGFSVFRAHIYSKIQLTAKVIHSSTSDIEVERKTSKWLNIEQSWQQCTNLKQLYQNHTT